MKKTSALILTFVLLFSMTLPVNAAGSFVYTDPASGNRLTIPSGWDLEYKDDSIMKVSFIPASGNTALMQYGSVDLWSGFSASQKKALPRAECSNNSFSKADIAAYLGCNTSDVNLVTVSGTEYFRGEFTAASTSGGRSVSMDATYWVRIYNGWMYIYSYLGSSSSALYTKFKSMVGSANYGSNTSEDPAASNGKATVYKNAVKCYDSGDYAEARKLFNSIPAYQNSSKYLRLIRIRNAGSNIGAGSKIYQKDCGLTEDDKADIDAAARDFYFADTAKVLLCNSDVACYYLAGEWNGGSKCYIHFKMNDYGGTYNIGSKLSTNYQSTFSINNGELRVDVTGSNKLTLHLTLTSPNCMEVYTYEKNSNTYTLNRS